MTTFPILKVARFFFYGGLTIFSAMTNLFLNKLKDQPNCPCNGGWRIENGVLLANTLLIISILNIPMPFNRVLYTVPLLGTTYMVLFLLLIASLLYILISISNELKEEKCKSCKLNDIKVLYNYFKDSNYKSCFYASGILVVIGFWL